MMLKEQIILKQLEIALEGLKEIEATPAPECITDQYAYKFGFLKAYVEQHLKDVVELIKQESK